MNMKGMGKYQDVVLEWINKQYYIHWQKHGVMPDRVRWRGVLLDTVGYEPGTRKYNRTKARISDALVGINDRELVERLNKQGEPVALEGGRTCYVQLHPDIVKKLIEIYQAKADQLDRL